MERCTGLPDSRLDLILDLPVKVPQQKSLREALSSWYLVAVGDFIPFLGKRKPDVAKELNSNQNNSRTPKMNSDS